MNLRPSAMSFFGSYSSSQHETPRKNSLAASQTLLLSRKNLTINCPPEKFLNHYPTPWLLSKVESDKASRTRVPIQHAPTDLPCRILTALQHVQSQYQQRHMMGRRSQDRTGKFCRKAIVSQPMTRVSQPICFATSVWSLAMVRQGFPEIGHVHLVLPCHQSVIIRASRTFTGRQRSGRPFCGGPMDTRHHLLPGQL